ncbi:MAG: hypothetical protein RR415_11440 [Ruthenibacterium sp.]
MLMQKCYSILLALTLCTLLLTNCAKQPPRQTDELVICAEQYDLKGMRQAVKKYRASYPDISVRIEYLPSIKISNSGILDQASVADRESTIMRLRTELMSGSGVDLFLLPANPLYQGTEGVYPLIADPLKSAQAGAFLDLNELIDNDVDFSREALLAPVLEACVVDGEQLLMPLSYTVQCALLSAEHPKVNNILAAKKSFSEFWSALENNTDSANELLGITGSRYPYLAFSLLESIDAYALDPLTGSISLDNAAFHERYAILEQYGPSIQAVLQNSPGTYVSEKFPEAVQQGALVLSGSDILQCIMDATYLDEHNIKPRLAYVPNEKNGITASIVSYGAIRRNSQNVLNAWNFLKMLLSPEFVTQQKDSLRLLACVPIWNEGLEQYIEYLNYGSISLQFTPEFVQDICSLPSQINGARISNDYERIFISSFSDVGQPTWNLDSTLSNLTSECNAYQDE